MKNFTLHLLSFMIVFLSFTIMAQTNFWEQTNYPHINTGSALAINSNGIIFVGTNNGILHSSDNGANWIENNFGSNLGLLDIAFNSTGTIFCAGSNGVIRSTDDGVNWTKIYDREPIKTIAVNNNGQIFIGWGHEISGGIERSADDGASWVNTGLGANSYAISTTSDSIIFSGGWSSDGGYIFRSTDNGDSWTNTNIVLSGNNVISSLEINPVGHIFAGTSEKNIYRSTDDGGQWIPVAPNIFVTSLASSSSSHIFAGTFDEGVYHSTDDGANWTTINTGLMNDTVISIAINPSGTIFALTTGGLFRSVQSTTSVKDLSADASIGFSLNQNYPNPFNPTTKIKYQIAIDGFVSLKVYDVLGKEIATLVNEEKSAGSYESEFSALGLSNGIYLYKLQTGNSIETKKMSLIK